MSDPETEAVHALERLFLQSGMQGVESVLSKFQSHVESWFPDQEISFNGSLQVGSEPTNGGSAHRNAHSLRPVPSRGQTSRDPFNPASRTVGRSGNDTPTPPSHMNDRQIIIDMSDDEPAKDIPTRSNITTVIPLLLSNSDHIFSIPTHHRIGHGTPVNTSTTLPNANFDQYLHLLRFRNPNSTCVGFINIPAPNSTGDGDAWYYVTVGRVVGVFNTWEEVNHSITGLEICAYKCMDTKEIALEVFTNALKGSRVEIVNK